MLVVSTTFLKSDYSLPLWSHELVDVCATVYCMCLHVSMYICLQCNFKSKSTTICPIPPLDPVSFHSYLFKCLSRWLRGGGGSKKLFWDFNYFPADVHNYFQASSASCIDCWNCVFVQLRIRTSACEDGSYSKFVSYAWICVQHQTLKRAYYAHLHLIFILGS